MDNKKIQSVIHDAVEEKIPASEIDLWQTVKASLVEKHTQQGVEMNPTKVRSLRPATAILAIVALVAIVLITPQGRAFAQELLGYFTLVPERTLPPMPTPIPASPYTLDSRLASPQPGFTELQDCGDVISPISSTFICQLQDAQTKL